MVEDQPSRRPTPPAPASGRARQVERLLDLHDDVDALAGKERHTGIAFVLLAAAALFVLLGWDMGSFYIALNGLVLGLGGAGLAGREIFMRRRINAMRKEIARLQTPDPPTPDPQADPGQATSS